MINIAGYQFEGPYTKTDSFKDNAGIYAILTRGQATAPWTVLDIGESDQVKSRIGNHDRKDCWNRNNQGTLAGAVLYTPDWTATQRRNLESSLREQYTPTGTGYPTHSRCPEAVEVGTRRLHVSGATN